MNDPDRASASTTTDVDLTGWLLIDKPAGMSSHDVLARLRRRHRKLKMGHAGTLDPLATGLLLVAIGSATRLVEATHALDKSYDARIRLGATSSTDDADGEITERPVATPPEVTRIQEVLDSLTGPAVAQVPPAVSAIHVAGKRAYDLVRQGVDVKLDSRPVRIGRIRATHYEWPCLDVLVDCGAGTYIRSIARDAGEILGCGGLIEQLRRSRIGPFAVSSAVSLEQAEAAPSLAPLLRPPVEALCDWPVHVVGSDEIERIARGQSVRIEPGETTGLPDQPVALVDAEGRLLALARFEDDQGQGRFQPYRVFVRS